MSARKINQTCNVFNLKISSIKEIFKKVLEIINSPDKIMTLAEETGKGSVLWPLRYALSGKEKSPDPFTLLDILEIEESKKRVEKAIEIL